MVFVYMRINFLNKKMDFIYICLNKFVDFTRERGNDLINYKGISHKSKPHLKQSILLLLFLSYSVRPLPSRSLPLLRSDDRADTHEKAEGAAGTECCQRNQGDLTVLEGQVRAGQGSE